jgi:hypothetical protein
MIDSFQKQRSHGYREWAALTLQLIRGARLGVQKLQADEAVLVHCTDGWDRTAQISSLIQIILDPFTRTMIGFRQLIDKEWCDAGHLFALRNAQKPVRNVSQSSPVFAQFIDAVWQLMAEQKQLFEYNESFLGFLVFHSYSQLYGDFMGDCYKERVGMERPPSIWSCFDDPVFCKHFVNEGFVPSPMELESSGTQYVISKLICSNPIFGCDSGLPSKVDAPEIEEEWMVVNSGEILIPQNDEPLGSDEAQDLIIDLEVEMSREPIRIVGSPIPTSIIDRAES